MVQIPKQHGDGTRTLGIPTDLANSEVGQAA